MSKRILVCDRKSLARIAYRVTLESAGYEVIGELNAGMDVVDRCRELKPDLVLMSAILAEPMGDGLMVIQRIMADNPEATVVTYAHPCIHSREECLRAGAKGFFLYPARPDEMLATVNSVMTGRASG